MTKDNSSANDWTQFITEESKVARLDAIDDLNLRVLATLNDTLRIIQDRRTGVLYGDENGPSDVEKAWDEAEKLVLEKICAICAPPAVLMTCGNGGAE